LPGNGWPEKVSAENRQFSGLTPGTAYLVLHSETLTDAVLEHVAALKHLQTLDVEGQYSVDALTALAELKELKKLTIRSVSPRNLNTTEYGRYDANLQRSWKQPVKFPLSVTSLRLIDLAVTDDDLAGLSSVTGLGGLRLEGSLIHGPGLAHLKGLPVSSLFLVRCRLRDDALDHLKGLPIFSLGLIQCGLHDDDLAHLPAFPLLSEQYSVLSLGHNHFTDAAIEKLPDNVWNIQLGNNPITGGTAADWQRFKNLVGLNLESTLVDDTIYSRVAGIPNLTYLDLRRTRVTGKGIKVLTGTKVDGLILDYCPVTPDGLTEICQLQQLTGLDLNGIRLTTEQLQMIGSSLPKLTYLSIVGCGLTDDEIAALRGDSLSHVRSLNTKFEPMQPIKVGYVTPPAGGKLGNFPGLLESENARKAQKGDDDQ